MECEGRHSRRQAFAPCSKELAAVGCVTSSVPAYEVHLKGDKVMG